MSEQQSDIEGVWEQLVGDAITPLPPPPEFAGAIDEEMRARPSARLPLHVVPLSGPDSDALPIVPTRAHEASPPSAPKKVDVRPRPQLESDAMAAPQAEVAADPVVAVDLRRRKLPPTLRTAAVPSEDELDVALFEVAQTGPHAVVSTDEIVELDVTDLDVDELEVADGRAVIDVDLVDEDDESAVAGVIDLAEPSSAPRTDGPRALARSAAIANAMRGATVRVPLVPERKVKTAMLSVSRAHRVPRPMGAGTKVPTVKTAVAVAHADLEEPSPGVARNVVPLALCPAPVTPTPPPAPAIVPTPTPTPTPSSSSSSSLVMRRAFVGERVVAPKRGMFAWIAGAAVLGLAAISVAALTSGDDPPRPPAAASVVATEQAPAPAVEPTPVLEPLTPANASPPTPPPDTSVEDARRAAGVAYVAAVERYESDQSNEALEQMVSAACAMDEGPRARSAFRKLRGGDQRSRVMIACRDRGIDLWARVDGPTAAELLTVAERQLAEGDWVHALETARESNHVSRNNGALLVMGIAHCRLGRAAEAQELERHLPPRGRADLQKACS